MAYCKSVQSTKELNQRLQRITDDLQDVHSKLNTVVAQQRRLDLPASYSLSQRPSIGSKRNRPSENPPSAGASSDCYFAKVVEGSNANPKRQKLKSSVIESKEDGQLSEEDDFEESGLSDIESDILSKPKLASSVISTKRILRTRDDLIGLINESTISIDGDDSDFMDRNSSNCDDDWSKAGVKSGSSSGHRGFSGRKSSRSNTQMQDRNRRMLGMVINTLNEFKKQNDCFADQSALRCQEVEDRRRKHAKEESLRLQQERQMLIQRKRDCLTEQRVIMAELERLERIQYWNRTAECLTGFIQTNTEPRIFWRPGLLEAKAKRKLDQSQIRVQEWISSNISNLTPKSSYSANNLDQLNPQSIGNFTDNKTSLQSVSLDSIALYEENLPSEDKVCDKEHFSSLPQFPCATIEQPSFSNSNNRTIHDCPNSLDSRDQSNERSKSDGELSE